MKLMIATPAYDGKVYANYALSLVSTTDLLKQNNISCDVVINLSGTLLTAERNNIINQFIISDCTHILCVDADLGWNHQDVLDMLTYDLDFVGGVYPSRQAEIFIFRPYLNDDGSLINKNGLFSMEYVPAGFMLLKKEAIQKMIDKFPETRFEPKDEKLKNACGWALFNTEVYDGEFWGEDYVFCRRAREAGIDIWINPLFEFIHGSVKGKLIDALSQRDKI